MLVPTVATLVPIMHMDVSKPWMTEFTHYLETLEAALASGMSMIQWWGVSTHKFSA